MDVVKRDGSLQAFDEAKIESAILKAMKKGSGIIKPDIAMTIAHDIHHELEYNGKTEVDIRVIEAMVFSKLIRHKQNVTARRYEGYRAVHEYNRGRTKLDKSIEGIVDGTNIEVLKENSNKAEHTVPTQRDLIAGEYSKDYTDRILLPDDIREADEEGIIHFHDKDYFITHEHNCCLINLDDMLQNGTVISETLIEPPKSFQTACTVTSQIVAQVASNQFGGQTWSLAHLAPFVDVSRQKIRKQVIEENEAAGITIDDEAIDKITEMRVQREIKSGIQTITYQLYTLLTTNGQTPFVSLNMYINEAKDERTKKDLVLLIEEVLNQRIQGLKNKDGVYVTPAFPKLLYFLQEDNIHEGDEYYWLTELAAKCAAKRMVPDFISEKIMLQYKGDSYPCMGCRSFLTPDRFTDAGLGNIAKAKNYVAGKHKYYGRFNQGVVTLNLVDVALSSGKDVDKFWKLMEDRCELVHRALRLRYERLKGTTSDIAPIIWQHGALARLEPGETIDELLKHGYSTISFGFAGLAECVQYITGYSHTNEIGRKFALEVMNKMNDKCAEWKKEEDIDYSVYGTPIESATYSFARNLRRRFGIIEGITDKDYITNSYHVNVREHIDAFDKLSVEAEFQKLSPGGCISYVEIPDMKQNIPAVMALIKHIYDNTMYGELNTKSDYCSNCGFDGEIITVEVDDDRMENGKRLIWRCPQCGCTDETKLHVARRTCGYIGSQFWNQGRTQEIRDRVLHL